MIPASAPQPCLGTCSAMMSMSRDLEEVRKWKVPQSVSIILIIHAYSKEREIEY